MESPFLFPARGVPATIDAGPLHPRSASIGAGFTLPTTLQIRNVVASVTVAESFRLDDLAVTISCAKFDRTFPKLVIRLSTPKATALIFHSGKIVLTGLHDPEAVGPALVAVLDVLRTAGADLADPVPVANIVNVVASGTFDDGVALIRLASARNFERIEFDPEQFPGLVYRSDAGPVVLVFSTGALIATGARSLAHANKAASEAWHTIDAAGAWQRRR